MLGGDQRYRPLADDQEEDVEAGSPKSNQPLAPQAVAGGGGKPRAGIARQLDDDIAASSSLSAGELDESESQGVSFGISWKKIGLKVVFSIAGFVLATYLVERYAEERVTEVSEKLMECIGLPGLFLAVFLADGIPQPFTYVPLIFMAVKGSVGKSMVFLVCATASYCAALTGYVVGYQIRSLERGSVMFDKLSESYPWVPEIMGRRGAVGVAFAAMLPIPLAIATWTAGSFQIYFPHFLMAGLCRMPKIALFVLLSREPHIASSG